ncbi:MAG: MerR family transcriptional regulator [Vicinamibacterales bacterium]
MTQEIAPPPPLYPIRAVSRMTGLTVDTLRAWERRYEAVVPTRNDRGRVYSEADVARLKRLDELVKQGHAIGTIAGSSDADLDQLLRGGGVHAVRPEPTPMANLDALSAAMDRYDLEAVEATLNRYAVLLPPRDLVFSVVLPLLQQIGERWQAGRLRPSQEHLVSAIIRSVLGGSLRAIARPAGAPRVVFATPCGDRHELGLLCGALLAATAGYGVLYLGADLPASDIFHAAEAAGARIIVLSLTAPGVVPGTEIAALAASAPNREVWVGGPAAAQLLATAGAGVRHIQALADVVPMLDRYAR